MKSLWVIRIFFLSLCVLAGYAISQRYPDIIHNGAFGAMIGFGLGGLLIGVDEMLKGFSLRAFSSVTFGLLLGMFIAWLLGMVGTYTIGAFVHVLLVVALVLLIVGFLSGRRTVV